MTVVATFRLRHFAQVKACVYQLLVAKVLSPF
jgi:hypothetical protein